jgi:hypothetical protein
LGQGCGLIDPHGDLANNLLKLLAFQPQGPNKRPWLEDPKNASRVIYCEPGRTDYFIPMNVLKCSFARSNYSIASNIIEAFQRTWKRELEVAPQFKNVTLHSLLLLIEHQLTIAELPWLFMDQDFRESLLEVSHDKDVIAFFRYRWGQWNKEQAVRTESLLNKVTALTLNPHLKLMLGSKQNVLDLRKVMDEGKILIVNLAMCDHETRDLLGSLLTVNLEQAALSRAELEMDKRRRWFAVLDEFQKFVANEGSSQVLAEMLSEVRKYKVYLCMAHQGWHQLENSRLEGALDQAQIKVVFGSGTKTGRIIAEELFEVDPQKVKHEVDDPQAQSRSHPYYESFIEQKEIFFQAIRNQKRREMFVLAPESNRVIALRTLTVPQPEVSPEQLEKIKITLLQKVGREVHQEKKSPNGQIIFSHDQKADNPVQLWNH